VSDFPHRVPIPRIQPCGLFTPLRAREKTSRFAQGIKLKIKPLFLVFMFSFSPKEETGHRIRMLRVELLK